LWKYELAVLYLGLVLGMSDPPSEVEIDPYPLIKSRQSERAQIIEAIRDKIQEVRRGVTSKRSPTRERIRWTRLAGQLIRYKDAILWKMSLKMERELTKLKDELFVRHRLPDAPAWYEPRQR
jgi:hypothetical protein